MEYTLWGRGWGCQSVADLEQVCLCPLLSLPYRLSRLWHEVCETASFRAAEVQVQCLGWQHFSLSGAGREDSRDTVSQRVSWANDKSRMSHHLCCRHPKESQGRHSIRPVCFASHQTQLCLGGLHASWSGSADPFHPTGVGLCVRVHSLPLKPRQPPTCTWQQPRLASTSPDQWCPR